MEHIPSWAVWGDGSGTTFAATAEAIRDGIVNFEIGLVITTSEKAGILNEVNKANREFGMDIKPLIVEGKPGVRQSESSQETVLEAMRNANIGNLALLGALTIMGKTLVAELNGPDIPEAEFAQTLDEARSYMGDGDYKTGYDLPADFPVIETDGANYHLFNTHPAPTIVTANTHGPGAHLRLVQLRSREGGHTLHVVAPGIDSGPIVASRKFPIRLSDIDASEDQMRATAAINATITQHVERALVPLDMQAISNAQLRVPE